MIDLPPIRGIKNFRNLESALPIAALFSNFICSGDARGFEFFFKSAVHRLEKLEFEA